MPPSQPVSFPPPDATSCLTVSSSRSSRLMPLSIPETPADRGGLKVGDTVTAVDGKAVKNGDELVAEIASRKPGTKVTLGIMRNGKKQENTVVVADRAKLFASRLGDEEEGGEEEGPKQS